MTNKASPVFLSDLGTRVAPEVMQYYDTRNEMPMAVALQEARMDEFDGSHELLGLTEDDIASPYFLAGLEFGRELHVFNQDRVR